MAVLYTFDTWTISDFQERLDDNQEQFGDTGETGDLREQTGQGHKGQHPEVQSSREDTQKQLQTRTKKDTPRVFREGGRMKDSL